MNARIESTIDASRSSSGVRVRVIPSSAAGAARDAARLLVQIRVARRPGLTLRPAVRARRALHASLRAPGRTTRVAKGTAGDARLGAVRRLRLRRPRRIRIRSGRRVEHVPRRPEERPQPPREEPSVRVSRVRRRVRARALGNDRRALGPRRDGFARGRGGAGSRRRRRRRRRRRGGRGGRGDDDDERARDDRSRDGPSEVRRRRAAWHRARRDCARRRNGRRGTSGVSSASLGSQPRNLGVNLGDANADARAR